METGYQRGKIQDESMLYEHRKHDGSLPLVGVNAFTDPALTAPRPRRSSWPGPARPKAEPARPAGRFSGQARRDRSGRAAPPQGGGGGGRTERLRGP
jgi:methylmalonyl-CoA mutase N-terminal domain/subunit